MLVNPSWSIFARIRASQVYCVRSLAGCGRSGLAILLSVLVVTGGCTAIEGPEQRKEYADTLAAASGWRPMLIATDSVPLLAYVPPRLIKGQPLTIYIEGDGLAWLNRSTPSADPTPRDPTALRMALAHGQGADNIVYVARACQYTDAQRSGCSVDDWTQGRFAPSLIMASDQAISRLKALSGASGLILVGYSGGAAVAALVAQRRDDVLALVTVAGNLDHKAWTEHHRVLPLTKSLNPSDHAGQLRTLPQRHWLGGQDRVMPPELGQRWPAAFRGSGASQVQVIPGFDHTCCWAEQWIEFTRQFPATSSTSTGS